MVVEYEDRVECVDFVVPTREEARALIKAGATNGLDLLMEVGTNQARVLTELERIGCTLTNGVEDIA